MKLYKNSAKVAKERLKSMKDKKETVRVTKENRKNMTIEMHHKED